MTDIESEIRNNEDLIANIRYLLLKLHTPPEANNREKRKKQQNQINSFHSSDGNNRQIETT